MLNRVELFRALSADALEALASRGARRRHAAGEVLMRQGEPSRALYVILSGRVSVDRATEPGTTVRLAELGPNEVVGEIGVLDGEPRTATVTALEETDTLELQHGALAIAIIESPALATSLLGLLSRRLRTADELIDQISRERRGSP
jgi:CRP-like cAMP-binding protein